MARRDRTQPLCWRAWAAAAVLAPLLGWGGVAHASGVPGRLLAATPLAALFNSTAEDDPQQRAALLDLYASTGGTNWSDSHSTYPHVWDSSVSYCRWAGVACCLLWPWRHMAPCDSDRDVILLDLGNAGLAGALPGSLSALKALQVLQLRGNPGLQGAWPPSLDLPRLVALDVHDTQLTACLGAAAGAERGGRDSRSLDTACALPRAFYFSTHLTSQLPGQQGLLCPTVQLRSYDSMAAAGGGGGDKLLAGVQLLLGSSTVLPPGAVVAGPAFAHHHDCVCAHSGDVLVATYEARDGAVDGTSWDGAGGAAAYCVDTHLQHVAALRRRSTLGIVLGTALPWLLLVGGVWLIRRHRTWLHRLNARRQSALRAKRGRFPGTPSVALGSGKGVLSLQDVLVTWVVTDVEGSTLLWEWDPGVMGRAIEQHNSVMRCLLDTYGGHEVRTDGDSFTLAFHDGIDAINYCCRAQEELLRVAWPPKLLSHEFGAAVTLGDVCDPPLPGQGPPLMAGLRVRMGINTGVPDDIFVHETTDHVDYRGAEYEAAADIGDLAAGGQILIGPKTFQRWNKVFGQMASEDRLAQLADRLAEAPVPEAGRAGGEEVVSSSGQRRSSLMAFGALAMQLMSPRQSSAARARKFSFAAFSDGGGGAVSLPQSPTAGAAAAAGDAGLQWLGGAAGDVSKPQQQSTSGLCDFARKLSITRSAAGGVSFSIKPAQHAESEGGPDSSRVSSGSLPVTPRARSVSALAGHTGVLGRQASGSAASVAAPFFGRPPSLSAANPAGARRASVPAAGTHSQAQALEQLTTAGELPAGLSGGVGAGPQLHGRDISRQSSLGGALERLPSLGAGPPRRKLSAAQGALGSPRAWCAEPAAGNMEADPAPAGASRWQRLMAWLRTTRGALADRAAAAFWWLVGACIGDAALPSGRRTQDLLQLPEGAPRGAPRSDAVELVDLGYYQWQPEGPGGGGDDGAAALPVVHLTQVLPSSLAPRLKLFPWPLPAVVGDDALLQQLTPGFQDAPGARLLAYPAQRNLLEQLGRPPPDKPDISVVFASAVGMKEISAVSVAAGHSAMATYIACARDSLAFTGGYECKEVGGLIMALFPAPAAAVEWAVSLQLALAHASWPTLGHAAAGGQQNSGDFLSDAALDFRDPGSPGAGGTAGGSGGWVGAGDRRLTARVGVFHGAMDRIVPHGKTGRADVLGPPANRAARLMAAALPGQVLCEEGMMAAVLEQWQAKHATYRAAAAALRSRSASRPSSPAGSRKNSGAHAGTHAAAAAAASAAMAAAAAAESAQAASIMPAAAAAAGSWDAGNEGMLPLPPSCGQLPGSQAAAGAQQVAQQRRPPCVPPRLQLPAEAAIGAAAAEPWRPVGGSTQRPLSLQHSGKPGAPAPAAAVGGTVPASGEPASSGVQRQLAGPGADGNPAGSKLGRGRRSSYMLLAMPGGADPGSITITPCYVAPAAYVPRGSGTASSGDGSSASVQQAERKASRSRSTGDQPAADATAPGASAGRAQQPAGGATSAATPDCAPRPRMPAGLQHVHSDHAHAYAAGSPIGPDSPAWASASNAIGFGRSPSREYMSPRAAHSVRMEALLQAGESPESLRARRARRRSIIEAAMSQSSSFALQPAALVLDAHASRGGVLTSTPLNVVSGVSRAGPKRDGGFQPLSRSERGLMGGWSLGSRVSEGSDGDVQLEMGALLQPAGEERPARAGSRSTGDGEGGAQEGGTPAVLAECFKITPAVGGPGEGGITLIKYNKMQLEEEQGGEDDPSLPGMEPAHLAALAAGATEAAWWPVAVHRMGLYKLKGVEAPMAVVQVAASCMVAQLESSLPRDASARGSAKAKCITIKTGLVGEAVVQLPVQQTTDADAAVSLRSAGGSFHGAGAASAAAAAQEQLGRHGTGVAMQAPALHVLELPADLAAATQQLQPGSSEEGCAGQGPRLSTISESRASNTPSGSQLAARPPSAGPAGVAAAEQPQQGPRPRKQSAPSVLSGGVPQAFDGGGGAGQPCKHCLGNAAGRVPHDIPSTGGGSRGGSAAQSTEFMPFMSPAAARASAGLYSGGGDDAWSAGHATGGEGGAAYDLVPFLAGAPCGDKPHSRLSVASAGGDPPHVAAATGGSHAAHPPAISTDRAGSVGPGQQVAQAAAVSAAWQQGAARRQPHAGDTGESHFPAPSCSHAAPAYQAPLLVAMDASGFDMGMWGGGGSDEEGQQEQTGRVTQRAAGAGERPSTADDSWDSLAALPPPLPPG